MIQLPESSYDNHKQRLNTLNLDEELEHEIKQLLKEANETYGYHRLTEALNKPDVTELII